MKKFYYLLEMVYSRNNYDKIYRELYLSGINKILEENGTIKVYFEPSELRKIEALKRKLLTIPEFISKDFVVTKIKSFDWDKSWKKSIEPVYIKNRIVITPTWKRSQVKRSNDQIIITIDPKMSFGTGHNETTQLMLEMMATFIDKDQSLLDYGCGTGILAIAGIKLGIKSAVAIDIDNDAIENAKENFRNNRISKKIKLYKSDIRNIKEKDFDIVCANINYEIISKSIKMIKSKLKKQGKLLISGILIEEKNAILELLRNNKYKILKINEAAEWLGIYCMKY